MNLDKDVIQTELQFLDSFSKPQKVKGITINHSKIPYSTIFDAHIDGLSNGKDGCECHYFIGRDGTVFNGKDDKLATDLAENNIVICLEGNLDTDEPVKVQFESLIDLCKELKKEYKVSDSGLNVDLSGEKFPKEKFLERFE